MGGKRAPAAAARLIHNAFILALALMLAFPLDSSSVALAFAAGYVLALNLIILRVCFDGALKRLR
jgi:hypothetical protein